MVRPSITTTRAEGTPICRCIESEPASSRPTNSAAGATAKRLDGAEQRDRHRLETEAEREALDEPMMDAENLDAAGETGERAGQEHGRPGEAGDRKSRIGRGAAGSSGDADGEAERRQPQRHRKRCRGGERQDESDMRVEARQLPEPRVPRHDRRLQEPGAGLAKRSRQSLLDDERANEIQQERDKHFVDAAPEMDGRCDR